MKVLHVTKINFKGVSGPAKSTVELCSSLSELENVKVEQWNLHNSRPSTILSYKFHVQLGLTKSCRLLSSFDLVVFNSHYIPEYIVISLLLKLLGLPYIVVPRGALSYNGQKIKPLKKLLGNIFFYDYLKRARSIQYLTIAEMESSIFQTTKFEIIPNGITTPVNVVRMDLRDPFVFIYIGRLDMWQKGLDLLIGAFLMLEKHSKDFRVELRLHGNFVRDADLRLRHVANYSKNIFVGPPVFGKAKERLLSNANVFVQTSRFEGLPMGVLEALSYGAPCILTSGTNLVDKVMEYKAGYACEESIESIFSAFLEAIEDADIREKSNNARRLAKTFNWNGIAGRSKSYYLECLK